MTEVTDVIVARDRLPDPEPFRTMIVWSMAAHLAALVLLLFGPFDWRMTADESPRTVMTMSSPMTIASSTRRLSTSMGRLAFPALARRQRAPRGGRRDDRGQLDRRDHVRSWRRGSRANSRTLAAALRG